MGRRRKPLDELKNYIRLQMLADACPEGSRLPPIQKLGNMFGMKYTVARKAVLELVDAGLLEHRHYEFRVLPWRKEGARGGRRIAVFMEYAPKNPGLYHQVLLGMLDEALNCDMHFDIRKISRKDAAQKDFDAGCAGMDGAVLLSSYDTKLPELSLPVPGVGVMMHPAGSKRISTVDVDLAQTARLAVGYFRKRHVGRVVICSAPRPAFLRRGRAFAEAFSAAGGTVEQFRSGEDFPTVDLPEKAGIFGTSDWAVSTLCTNYFNYTGIWLPDRRPVLGTDGRHTLGPFVAEFSPHKDLFASPPFSTIEYDWIGAGALVLRELQRLMDDPAAEKRDIAISGKLREIPLKHRK